MSDVRLDGGLGDGLLSARRRLAVADAAEGGHRLIDDGHYAGKGLAAERALAITSLDCHGTIRADAHVATGKE